MGKAKTEDEKEPEDEDTEGTESEDEEEETGPDAGEGGDGEDESETPAKEDDPEDGVEPEPTKPSLAPHHFSSPSAERAAAELEKQIEAQKIEGDTEDYVAVEYFNTHFRGLRQRVFSKREHGKKYAELAKSFSVANPRPKVNNLGLILPEGVAPAAADPNILRYVSANEAQAIKEENQAEHDAVNARRDRQYGKGEKVTP